MIKNLLTAAAIALLAAGSAFAEGETVFIGETGYANLKAAVEAATDGQTITVTANQTLTGRFDIGKSVTIKGVGDNITITNTGKANFILINGGDPTLENLTFDATGYNPEAKYNKYFEVDKCNSATFKNCVFKNFKLSRVIFAKKKLTLDGVSAVDCENETGFVFLGSGNYAVTVAGASSYSIGYEAFKAITAGEQLSGNINLILPAYTSGTTIVNGTTDASVFTLANAPAGYKLAAEGNNLVLVYEKDVVLNETTGVSYTSFDAAYKAAQSKDVLILLENITLADRYLFNINDVTIKGANPNITITRGNFTNKLFLGANQNTTLEDLVLDCDNKANNNFEFQAGTNTFTLKNVKIINSQSTKGLFDVKELTRTLNLTDVTKENCTSATPDINLSGKLILSGNTNLSVGVTFNPGTINVDGELTNEQPIELTLATVPELGTTIVSGTTDYKKFTVTNEGFYLNPDKDNNNLVLGDQKTTGIEDVVVDENAPVEYYNLSGMRVNGDNMAPGVYIKRQGAKATKVYVK